MIMRLNKEYQKTVQVKGKTFLICIYDDGFGLPFTDIYEIREKKHFFDFGWKTRIFHYWIEDGNKRIEYAMSKIEDYLKEKEEFEKFQKELDSWVNNMLK